MKNLGEPQIVIKFNNAIPRAHVGKFPLSDFDWISLVNDWMTTHCIPLFNEDMLDMTSVASVISYVDLFITSQLFTK
jgi:hypothetical protein